MSLWAIWERYRIRSQWDPPRLLVLLVTINSWLERLKILLSLRSAITIERKLIESIMKSCNWLPGHGSSLTLRPRLKMHLSWVYRLLLLIIRLIYLWYILILYPCLKATHLRVYRHVILMNILPLLIKHGILEAHLMIGTRARRVAVPLLLILRVEIFSSIGPKSILIMQSKSS